LPRFSKSLWSFDADFPQSGGIQQVSEPGISSLGSAFGTRKGDLSAPHIFFWLAKHFPVELRVAVIPGKTPGAGVPGLPAAFPAFPTLREYVML
jgi:hypothetical protein